MDIIMLLQMERIAHFTLAGCNFSASEGLERQCLHTSDHALQTMIIRMPAYYTYDFIKDELAGEISFTVLEGELYIDILMDHEEGSASYSLDVGDVLYLPRNVYRRTSTGLNVCIYLENLSGGFSRKDRLKLHNSMD